MKYFDFKAGVNLETNERGHNVDQKRYKCDECPNYTNDENMEPGILDEHFLLSHPERLTTLPLKPLLGKIQNALKK